MTEQTTKFENFVRIAVCFFAVCLMGVLTVAGLFSTTGMEIVGAGEGMNNIVLQIREDNETVWYYHDNIFANLIWLAIGFAICFAVMPYLKKLSLKKEMLIVSLWVIVLGSVWVISSQVMPTYDSKYVSEASWSAAENDFSWMEDEYFSYYSYQTGYVLFNEILIRIYKLFSEPTTLIFLQILNVIFLALIYDGILLLNKLLFQDERIHHLTAALMLFSIQPVIACVFIYGIYPGMVFAVWGMVFEVWYFRTEQLRFIPLSAVCIAVAYAIKPNYLIFLIAMMIIVAVKAVHYRKDMQKLAVCGAYIIMSCTLAFALPGYAISSYESRSGIILQESIPMTSFIAMGLNEGMSAPGWYNIRFTVRNFEEHNCNAQEASEASKENIRNRLQYFSENKKYRNEFFYQKFVSQWNETSYQSIWNNKVRKQYKEKGKLSSWVCNGGEQKVKEYMDIYTQMIFTGVLFGSIICFRRKNFMQVLFPMVIIGGMLYHLMAESKSQYAMPYYILMMGFASVGICWLYDRMQPYIKLKLRKRDKLETTERSDKDQQIPELDSPAQSGNSGN